MIKLHEEYSDYDFISNKGYGTKPLISTEKIGPCKIHRKLLQKLMIKL